MESIKKRIALYKEALSLEEKRVKLREEMDQISTRLTAINNQLVTDPPAAADLSQIGKQSKRRGLLKREILKCLSDAGASGMHYRELAQALGAKPTNIYGWFQMVGKNIPGIEKVGRGIFRFLQDKNPGMSL
jgi:hypothetical protein